MGLEGDLLCIRVNLSSVFPPFEEMYTWLGRIRDSQLPAEMIIDEEGYGVILRADFVAKNAIEFSIKSWMRNEDTVYFKTEINPKALLDSFHDEIISFIEKQTNLAEPCFIIRYEYLNWDSLLKQPIKPQDWNKRLAIYGGGRGNYNATSLDDFSLTEKETYLIELESFLNKIYRLPFTQSTKGLIKLAGFYRELIIDLALDEIDSDWYEKQKEKLNNKYQIEQIFRVKPIKEIIEERKRQIEIKKIRLPTLKIGQIVDGTIKKIRSYGVFVNVGGISALLHISNVSYSPIADPEQVFYPGDWVRAKIVDLDIERGRVSLSTKDIEQEPGQMLTEPWTVYQNASINNEAIDRFQ